jgi:hypothetical protein
MFQRLTLHAWTNLLLVTLCLASALPAVASQLTINSPANGASPSSSVNIAASAKEGVAFHLELWDNGNKLGDVFSNTVNSSFSMSQGTHTLTVLAVSNNGQVLDSSVTNYTVSNASSSGLQINSPGQGSTSTSAVNINVSGNEPGLAQLEIWDNGFKLGVVPSTSVNDVYVLPSGTHNMTVKALAHNGSVLDSQNVSFQVAENCSNSATQQCNLDQLPIDNTQGYCNPPSEIPWVANPCGNGVQGDGADPINTWMGQVNEWGGIPDQGNYTLNGTSAHFVETQGSEPSNTLFRSQSPSLASPNNADSNWTMDEYVYLPDPTAHQAFEVDAQYTVNNLWTKFYTECAFNMNNGTGYWAVFDSSTGGWIFLNGKSQGGQTPPVVPCNRSQFAQPWANSGDPSFTGWHHIAWNFTRNSDGTVTYQSLVFDGTTTQINFHPNSQTGGQVNDSGHFGALVQLDGVTNHNRKHDTVDAYVSEINLTHNQ